MDRQTKKKPLKQKDSAIVQAAKEEVLPGYEEYLVLLQERNKLMKRLRKKNQNQIDLEKKEEGFSLYVNGPHKNAKPGGRKPSGSPQKSARQPPKTAGDEPRNPMLLDHHTLDMLTQEELEKKRERERAKTAPSARERRRNWNVASVEIKTTDGKKQKVKAPTILTGKYDDDFEMEDSNEFCSSDSYNSTEEIQKHGGRPRVRASDDFRSSDSCNSMEEDSDGDIEIDAGKFQKRKPVRKSQARGRNSKSSIAENSEDYDGDDDGHNDRLLLSMSELKTLRHSLARNDKIRQSLAQEVRSDDESFVPESPIPEVEEDLVAEMESTSLEDEALPSFQMKKPAKLNDTVVLEFSNPSTKKGRIEKNLSAARKQDADSSAFPARSGSAGSSRQGSQQSLARSHSSNSVLKSDTPPGKAVRPLSANRRNKGPADMDTDAEAVAVLAALQEENAQAAKFNKEDKNQASKKRPTPRSSRESVPKPVIDQAERAPKQHQMKAHDTEQGTSSQGKPLVSPEKIDYIMGKVLRMTPNHQRRLVKMLGNMDTSVSDSVENVEKSPNPRKSFNRGPVKPTREAITKMRHSMTDDTGNTVELCIELLSNWGHSMKVGLTEIQVYDDSRSLVSVAVADVSVLRAEEETGSIGLLFNGKFRTNKERNMWSCRYRARRPVEIYLKVNNPKPDTNKNFKISSLKVWNFNKSITELDVGVKKMRVSMNGELVYDGDIEKGCGNQVFDYGHVVPLQKEEKEPPKSSHENNNNNSTHVEEKMVQETPKIKEVKIEHAVSNKTRPSKIRKSPESSKTEKLQPSQRANNSKSSQRQLPPASPRNDRSPSPSLTPRYYSGSRMSPRDDYSDRTKSSNHRNISPSRSREPVRLIRSISKSSQSSASDGGDSRPASTDGSVPRTETRTMKHTPNSRLDRPSIGSDSETDDGNKENGNKTPRRRGVRTPRKSKRMAARLDGLSSTEVDSSKSVSESSENRPPLPKPRKSQEKPSHRPLPPRPSEVTESKTSESQDMSQSSQSDQAVRKSDGVASLQASSVSHSEDDTPMLQRLKEMNNKEQTANRKKDIPRWLKAEDIAGPFQSPSEGGADNLQESSAPDSPQPPVKPPTQDEINSLIEEELSLFPGQKTDGNEEPSKQQGANDDLEEGPTPMDRIQKQRSHWRENQGLNLEESWGSLTQFNQSQRGRLSLNMDDDVMDEYINAAAKKSKPVQQPIPEEDVGDIDDLIREEMEADSSSSEDDGFVIPELPSGKDLVIDIKSTWGDKHYVGLTGIEIFTCSGEPASVAKIKAEPSDINILPEYKKDPRVVTNLIDGVNRTRDDVHMWLAPFTQGKNHTVNLSFEKPSQIALIRIWNYNKSRIHSYRGVKDVKITLDGALIFKGEIARACGGVEGGTEAFGDTILFTMDEAMLEAVSQYDEAFEGEMLSDDEPFDVERPSTADYGSESRPLTRAVGNVKKAERQRTPESVARETTSFVTCEGNILVYKGQHLELNWTATWGDHHYLGLTGLEVVGKDGEAIPLTMNMLTATPTDLRSLPGNDCDDRTLDKVIDGLNTTMSDEHMWMIPFTEGQNHTLEVDFGEKVMMAGLRIWNYNKSKEDTYRGARCVHVTIDGKSISPPEGYLVRKGPGNCHFDFAQEISFSPNSANNLPPELQSPSINAGDDSQNYEVVQMPNGFIYQFQLFSTWGDSYYVGLNGIEFYDASFRKIQLTQTNISAYPDSVNVLEKIQNDVRTPDKLINGQNDTMDGKHMWLAPLLPAVLNRVYVIFDQPTAVSMIKIWNYSKTSNRGAKEFALLVDDLLVYNGVLSAVSSGARGILPTCEGPQSYHTILFSNNKEVLKKERNTIINNQTGEQDVQMTNDKKVVSHYSDPKKAKSGKPIDQNLRPKTSVIGQKTRRR